MTPELANRVIIREHAWNSRIAASLADVAAAACVEVPTAVLCRSTDVRLALPALPERGRCCRNHQARDTDPLASARVQGPLALEVAVQRWSATCPPGGPRSDSRYEPDESIVGRTAPDMLLWAVAVGHDHFQPGAVDGVDGDGNSLSHSPGSHATSAPESPKSTSRAPMGCSGPPIWSVEVGQRCSPRASRTQ
jgi:hypothetical protein